MSGRGRNAIELVIWEDGVILVVTGNGRLFLKGGGMGWLRLMDLGLFNFPSRGRRSLKIGSHERQD